MSAFDILQRWLQPLIDPLHEVRGVIQQPLSIHQEAVSTFASLIAGLYDGPDGFQGDAADAVKATTESYLHVEAQFSGAGSAATGTFAAASVLTIPTAPTETVLESAASTSVECAVEITDAASTAAAEMGADAGLDAVTEVVDVAAVAQAGLDPVTDIPAGVLTAIDLGTKIVILVALGWSIFQAVQRWISDMNRLGYITWPPLPSFIDSYGSSSGFTNQGGLTREGKLAEELFQEFGNSGITLDEILQIIRNNPNLSKDQLRQRILLKQLEQRKGYPGKLLTAGYSEDQVRKMIRAGFTNVHMAVILKEPGAGPATTPEGRALTRHALEDSVIRHGLTLQQIDDIIDNPTRITQQIDGAKVYVQKNVGRGQTYSIVIESDQGIITALKNLSKQELSRLGHNNGFNPAP